MNSKAIPSPFYFPPSYEKLENFIICYFYDELQYSDEENARDGAEGLDPPELNMVIEQGNSYLKDPLFDWKVVANASNRHLLNEKNARQWLQTIIDQCVGVSQNNQSN